MQIIPYDEDLHKLDFERLNREWIEREFEIESHDEAVFASPQEYVITRGGFIFMAEHADRIVGTCAAIHLGEGVFELAKLAVTGSAQGLGLGRALCEKIIAEAKRRGARELIITTNTKLDVALQLYEKLGFVKAPDKHHERYKRCNLSLVLPLR